MDAPRRLPCALAPCLPASARHRRAHHPALCLWQVRPQTAPGLLQKRRVYRYKASAALRVHNEFMNSRNIPARDRALTCVPTNHTRLALSFTVQPYVGLSLSNPAAHGSVKSQFGDAVAPTQTDTLPACNEHPGIHETCKRVQILQRWNMEKNEWLYGQALAGTIAKQRLSVYSEVCIVIR